MNTRQRYPLFKKDKVFSSFREQFPNITESSHLVFQDEKGNIRAGCYFGEDGFPIFDLGLIPKRIASMPPERIKRFAKRRARKLIAREKIRLSEELDRIKNLRHEFKLDYRGIILRGYLTKGVDNGSRDDRFVLTMTEPFQVNTETFVRPCCFADGMANIRSFDDDGNILPEEIARQESELINLYRRELQRRKRPPKHPALAKLPTTSNPEED